MGASLDLKIFLIVRLRQEEKRQQEETNRVKERKRKREKYAEKVCQVGVVDWGWWGCWVVPPEKTVECMLVILVAGWYPAPSVCVM